MLQTYSTTRDTAMKIDYMFFKRFNSLHIAAKKGFTEVATELLKHSSEIYNSKTAGEGKTALMIAAFEGHIEVVKLLAPTSIDDVDTAGNSCLHYSAWGGRLDVTKYLIETCGIACKKCLNNEGLSPLQFAAAGNHVDILEYLTSLDEELSLLHVSSCGDLGYFPLHRACV